MAEDPLDLAGLRLGVAFLAQDELTDATTLANKDRCINEEYIGLCGKSWFRKRTFEYTSSSTPALTDGTRAYNTPTTSGAVFDAIYRLYYRRNGRYIDVPCLGDEEWLMRSATQSTDKGDPQYARLVQTSSSQQIELDRAISQTFINSIATLTLEHFIRVVKLSGATDEPILPGNLRHLIIPGAAYRYALAQKDFPLANALKAEAVEARRAVLKADLTRTGRPRRLRPEGGYEPVSQGTTDYDYQSR